MLKNENNLLRGVLHGLPIGAGYVAVSFSLGICAGRSGLNPFQGFMSSFLNHAATGEKALYNAIGEVLSCIQIAVITFVVNARYLLMSCALSQKFSPETSVFHRIFCGFGLTDEIFGLAINSEGYVKPLYYYGAMLGAIPFWATGTALGVFAGSILPTNIVQALSVSLYGMFLAIIIPPVRKSFFLAVTIIVTFGLSYACSVIPRVKDISSGNITIILTVLISFLAALIKPVSDTDEQENGPVEENQKKEEN